MKKILKVKAKGKAVIEPEIWKVAMNKQFKDPRVQNICLCLAKTPATIFKDLKLVQGTDMDKVAITTIWKCAQQLLGTIEDIPKPLTEFPQKEPIPKADNKARSDQNARQEKSGVQFTPETKGSRKPGNRRFLSQEKPKPVTTSFTESKGSSTDITRLSCH
jgi:hypothetical protein